MNSSDGYADIESAIYEAAVLPELWPATLERINSYSGTAATVMLCLNERGLHTTNSPNFDELVRRFHAENWMARNARAASLIERGLVGVPRFVTEEDVFEPGQEMTDPMIQELFRPAGFGRGAGFIVKVPHGDTLIVSVEQYWDRGPIRGDNLAALDSFYPHLARAALLASRADLRRVQTAVETMSGLGLPAAAVSPSGRIIVANPEFDSAQDVWTTRGGDALALIDRVADRLLTESLAQISSASGSRSIPIRQHPTGPATAVLQLVPIRRSAFDLFGSSAALAILSRPAQGEGPDATLIQSLFDLSPAELAVAREIVAGRSPAQIAAGSGRSVSTIRNQLRSIMTKTGCTRQVELVVLMNQLAGRLPTSTS